MREDIREMNDAVDEMWLALAISFGCMVVLAYGIMGILVFFDKDEMLWLEVAAPLPMLHWLRASLKLRRLTNIAAHNNERLRGRQA